MSAKIPIEKIIEIRKEIRNGKTRKQIAKETKIYIDTICKYSKHITPGRLNNDFKKIIREEVLSGKTKKQVSIEYSLAYETVRKITSDINKLSNEDIALIREKVRSGKIKKQIARETDISYYIILKHTTDICFNNSIPSELIKQIKDKWNRGKPKQQIAEELNVSYNTVQKYTVQGHDKYRTYREVPSDVIEDIRKQVKQGISKMQVSRNLNISYTKVKRFTRDIQSSSNNKKRIVLPKYKIQKIRNEVKNGKTKIQVAREMDLSTKVVYRHTTDIITGHVHDRGLSGKNYEFLKELMRNRYVLPSKRYTNQNYLTLCLKFPNIKRVKMYGKVIYFLEDKADLACKIFLQNLPKKITSYYELKQVIDAFKAHMKKEEKKQYIIK